MEFVRRLYDRFNARDVDGVLAALAEDVMWANGMEGGYVRGREAVRAYWLSQWAVIDPHVEPVRIGKPEAGSILVEVRQVVRDLEGTLLLDETVLHRFHIEDELVTRFDIERAGGLSQLGR